MDRISRFILWLKPVEANDDWSSFIIVSKRDWFDPIAKDNIRQAVQEYMDKNNMECGDAEKVAKWLRNKGVRAMAAFDETVVVPCR